MLTDSWSQLHNYITNKLSASESAALHSVQSGPAQARHPAACSHPGRRSQRQAGHRLPEVRKQEVHEDLQVRSSSLSTSKLSCFFVHQ